MRTLHLLTIIAAGVALAAAVLPAAARSGSGHSGSNSGTAHAAKSAPRDAASGLATGKRQYKPVRMQSSKSKPKPKKLTPEKTEAGSENIRR